MVKNNFCKDKNNFFIKKMFNKFFQIGKNYYLCTAFSFWKSLGEMGEWLKPTVC